jgi:hypothetical protein
MSVCNQATWGTVQTSDFSEQTAREDAMTTAQPTKSRIQRNRQSSLT